MLLCAYHHHLVHHSGWAIRMRQGRPEFLPPRWLDPEQRPRRNDVTAPTT
jgi:5-methylcytosine-specific restriction protein A